MKRHDKKIHVNVMLILALYYQENISMQSQAFSNFTHGQRVSRNEIIRP